ncbi:MAG: hypothetical protein ACOYN2_02495 [Patescibacteria group bacterium]
MTLVLPVCIAIIILVIIIKAIMGSSSSSNGTKDTAPAGTASVQVIPKKDAKVSIYMSSDTQKELTGPAKLLSGDKMVKVDSGDADIEIEGSTSKISIESLSELHYDGLVDGKQTFTLNNGYAWVDSPNGDVIVKLKLFSVTADKGTVYIVSQNTRASNAYVLKGGTAIAAESASTLAQANQMISLLLSEAKNTNIADKVVVLDDFIKQSSIYIKKDGSSVLSSVSDIPSATGSTASGATGVTTTGTGETNTTNGKSVSFTYPEDEMSVDTGSINITGKLLNSTVSKIVIGKREAQVLKDDKSFRLNNYLLPDASNDLSYKVFDDAGVVIEKGVITVNVNNKKTAIKKPDVVNYPVSNKDFKIISPADNPFKTTETSVKLRGSFAANMVKYIKVNNYQLQQFKAFGTSWSYNASIDNGNMEEGMNEYLITYYGPSDEVLGTTKIYVVKDTAKPALPTETHTTPVAPAADHTASGTTKPSL